MPDSKGNIKGISLSGKAGETLARIQTKCPGGMPGPCSTPRWCLLNGCGDRAEAKARESCGYHEATGDDPEFCPACDVPCGMSRGRLPSCPVPGGSCELCDDDHCRELNHPRT